MKIVAPLNVFLSLTILMSTPSAFAAVDSAIGIEPDWSASATIDPEVFPNGRKNIYQWDQETFRSKVERGRNHALHYPVPVTGVLMPARPTLKILDAKPGEPIFAFMKSILSLSTEFQDFKGFWEWLGLTPPAKDSGEEYPMGVSKLNRYGATGITLSCAACHSSQLFGKPVFGMTNRFPRANLFFMHGKAAIEKITPNVFSLLTGANHSEKMMYADSRNHLHAIGAKKPITLGLDTSLAQVALSLAKRAPNENADRSDYDADHPRPNLLDHLVADSKPAVWWNAKYKTRWLSDGSILSGNPVFTNFLWNEIGRGVDLPELIEWLAVNPDIVQELTTAVFATEAPKWKDFLGEHTIDITRAKRGAEHYAQNCAKCHGEVTKAWDLSPFELEKEREHAVATGENAPTISDTIRLKYVEKVKDVGTDEGRRKGMKALAEGLNPLAFSKNFGIVIEEQPGYVAPPLEGIWARYPYFHNNSIPNLCALMMPPEQRPAVYHSGKAIDPDRDYDRDCVGYPLGEKTPSTWKQNTEHRFDTRLPGLSNSGHYERIFTKDGLERYSSEDKKDLIEFLKTL